MIHTISSDRLSVQIALPHEAPDCTTRFDRAGFITQVTLDGKHTFCTEEPQGLAHPCTGGVGLCNEYKQDTVSEEAPIGEMFPKFGVGLIEKPDEQPYIFHRSYDDVVPFEVKVQTAPDSVVFETAAMPCCGYAVEQKKTVQVQDDRLIVTVQLKNVGERTLEMEEYCHNFVSIDKLPIGPEYRLEFTGMGPQDGRPLNPYPGSTLIGQGNGYTFTAYNAKAAMSIMPPEDMIPDQAFSWTLTHENAPVFMREETSFAPSHVSIWAIDHIISPEVFHAISLEPGEETEWTRTFVFAEK